MSDNLNTGQEGQPPVEEQPQEKLIFGKYKTEAEAEAGYWNAVEEMNKTKGIAVEALQALKQARGSTPPATQTKPAYETRLEELGIPTDALAQLVDARAEQIAEKRMRSELDPMVAGMNARTRMSTSYPDYQANEAAILQFVERNPQLAQRFEASFNAGEPLNALELGYFHWKQSGAKATPSPEIVASRTQGGMPSNTGPSARTAPMARAGDEQKRLEGAYQHYVDTKDYMPWLSEAFGDAPLTYTEQMQALVQKQ